MDFAWSPEAGHRLEQARRFAEERLSGFPRPEGFDRSGWAALAEIGLFRMPLPEAWGGERSGALATLAVLEALGRGGADRGLLFAAGAHMFGCAVPASVYGTRNHSASWGRDLCTGSVIGALAVTEAVGGSSLELLTTQATETAGGYVLSGEKVLIANAPEAGLFLVIARQFRDRGPLGLTAFLVPSDRPGLTVTPIAPSVGLPGLALGRVRFAECFVPADSVLGRPGAGLKVFATAMQWERTCLLAGFLGAADRELSACVDALHGRRDSHGSLLRHQAVSHRLARIKLNIESARLLGYRAAWSIDQAHEDPAAAAMAKLALSEAAVDAALGCLRLMAGAAWRRDSVDCSAALGDSLGGLFSSGTSEVQLDIVARHLQSGYRGT